TARWPPKRRVTDSSVSSAEDSLVMAGRRPYDRAPRAVNTLRRTSMRTATLSLLLAVLVTLARSAGSAWAQCPVTVGVVMELTGPAGQVGQAGAKSGEVAFRDLNEAAGPGGCQLTAEIRDAQSQGAVAVDAAKQLVEIKRVPAIIGGIISPISIPILTSVTAPSGVCAISAASSC